MTEKISVRAAAYLAAIIISIAAFVGMAGSHAASAEELLPPVTGFHLESGKNSVILSFDMPEAVDGVEVYRSRNGKTFRLISRGNSNSYENIIEKSKDSSNKVYYYKIRYYKNLGAAKVYSNFSQVISCSLKSARRAGKGSVSTTADSVTLRWNAVEGADGYDIYRYDDAAENGTKVKTTKNIGFTDKGVIKGKKYSYEIKPYKKINGKVYYKSSSQKMSVCVIEVPAVSLATDVEKEKTTVSWDVVDSADSYRVYTRETGKAWKLQEETKELSLSFDNSVYPDIYVSVAAVYKDGKTISCSERSEAKSITEARAIARLVYLEPQYPTDKFWNNGGVSDIPCNHEAGIKYCNRHTGAVTYFTMGGLSTQCNGFACMLNDAIFGDNAPISTYSGWENIRPGDQLRLVDSIHSIIVIDKTDDYVTVAECNAIGGGCRLCWHREISRTSIEYQDHYCITRYPDELSDGTCAVGLVTDYSGVYTSKSCEEQIGYFTNERVCIINETDPDYYYVSTTYGSKGYIKKDAVKIIFDANKGIAE